MASTYTGLGTQLMTTGEKAGTWGTLTNTNWNISEQIAGGYTAQALSTTGATTLSVNDGTAGATLAHRVIEFTAALAGNVTVTIPLDVQTFYIIKNSTTNSFVLVSLIPVIIFGEVKERAEPASTMSGLVTSLAVA